MTSSFDCVADVKPRDWRIIIGSGLDTDLHRSEPGVAPRHASVYITASGLHITPLEGRVVVNCHEVLSPQRLIPGDRVELGACVFTACSDGLRSMTDDGREISVKSVWLITRVQEEDQENELTLLRGVTFSIGKGEFVGLLGPSGSGKSTLIRCLLGINEISSGSISVGSNQLPQDAAALWREIGYVPQENLLFPTLTVFENLDYSLRLRQPELGTNERQSVINKRLDNLNLMNIASKPVRKLSGGEKRRTSVAQELLSAPKFLFLDEPAAGLDPANEAKLMTQLHKIAENGISVVCATHVLESAQLLSLAIILVDGAIAFKGPPQDMLKKLKAKTYCEVYEKERLEVEAQKHLEPRPENTQLRPKSSSLSPRANLKTSGKRIASAETLSRVQTLLERNARIIWRDRYWVIMLLCQPIAIAFLIVLSQSKSGKVELLYTFAAVTSVWLGMTNTCRELVKERQLHVRERFCGLSTSVYLCSKVVLFSAIGAAQILLLVGTIFTLVYSISALEEIRVPVKYNLPAVDKLFPRTDNPQDNIHVRAGSLAFAEGVMFMCFCLFLAYLGAVMTGLCVSACAPTQEWAVALVPLLILPQLLFTREAIVAKNNRLRPVASLLRWDGSHSTHLDILDRPVEFISFFSQTRPCITLLSDGPPSKMFTKNSGEESRWVNIVRFVADCGHSVLAVLGPLAALVLCVRWFEKGWISSFGRPSE